MGNAEADESYAYSDVSELFHIYSLFCTAKYHTKFGMTSAFIFCCILNAG